MEKMNIRSDLSIGDQKQGFKMNSNGLWICDQLLVCGKQTIEGLKECELGMLEANRIVDLANKGRGPIKKKVVKKTVETSDKKPEIKKKASLKLKKNPEKLEISGGTNLTTKHGESGEKGKNLSG